MEETAVYEPTQSYHPAPGNQQRTIVILLAALLAAVIVVAALLFALLARRSAPIAAPAPRLAPGAAPSALPTLPCGHPQMTALVTGETSSATCSQGHLWFYTQGKWHRAEDVFGPSF